jgi:hypothetical protein
MWDPGDLEEQMAMKLAIEAQHRTRPVRRWPIASRSIRMV